MNLTGRFLPSREAPWCRGVLALSFAAYLWIFLPLIPASGDGMGHDYSSYLPNVLAGYYWFLQNGALAVPWFTPAQCGGAPYFADPTTGYYTVPQWLTIVAPPIAAVRMTFALFAAIGAVGLYLLLRRRFAGTRAAATAGAVLFLFSGLFAYRHAVGHVALHAYALTPWLAWTVLTPPPPRAGRVESLLSAAWPPVVGGTIVAYMFQASMTHFIPAAVLAVVVMVLIHGQLHGHRVRTWGFLAGAGLVSCALSASRLAAFMAFVAPFPRTQYPLPGFSSAWDLLSTAAAALFWRVSAEGAMQRMTGVFILLSEHEWEYGLGPAALALLAAGAASLARRPQHPGGIARALPAWGAIALVLALPLVLNWYEPRWNSLLKSLPLFGSSSNLLRWFALYVPVVALTAGLALQRVAPGATRGIVVVALAAAATIAWNAAANKTYYAYGQNYDGVAIEAAWREVRESGRVPPITHITVPGSGFGHFVGQYERNNALVFGFSQMRCYQPVFGYWLEKFPVRFLRPGPALGEVQPGVLNIKNPACYLYPEENRCRPGDHFAASRRADAERFLDYRPFPFARSPHQHVADWVTLAALCCVVAVLCASALCALRKKLRNLSPGTP